MFLSSISRNFPPVLMAGGLGYRMRSRALVSYDGHEHELIEPLKSEWFASAVESEPC